MLRALPPRISPTFAVVSSSMRPSRISAIARAAAAIALRPCSGAMPEWASRPMKRASMLYCVGASSTMPPIGEAWSNT